MFALLTLLTISVGNWLFGYVPESATLLVFGISLIAVAVAIRRLTAKPDDKNKGKHAEK